MIQITKSMNKSGTIATDYLYRDRLRTLITSDNTVANIINFLEKRGVMSNTYFVYTSDNGYHLGQFCVQGEKRQPYETDIRIPLIVRGPGIPKNVKLTDIALTIDLTPTFVDIANARTPPNTIDGVSLLPLLKNTEDVKIWRDSFLIEFHGETNNSDEIGYPYSCFISDGFIHDCWNNTYNLFRVKNSTHDITFANWSLTPFKEYYDLLSDPYELENRIDILSPSIIAELMQDLKSSVNCVGRSCHRQRKRAPPLLRSSTPSTENWRVLL